MTELCTLLQQYITEEQGKYFVSVSVMSDLILFVQRGKQSADMTGTNAYDTAIKL